MAKVLLGVTGSVAAIKTPELFRELSRRDHEVRVVATNSATYFFDPAELGSIDGRRSSTIVSLDADEWPGNRYQRGDDVLHIELRKWADVLLIAPLDANTLGKFTSGICDNCLTCVWRAWDAVKPVILAPAMNTMMWEHPMTARQLASLAADFTKDAPTRFENPEAAIEWINQHSVRLQIIPPISKLLACGDVGVGAMASIATIADSLGAGAHR